VRFRRPLILMAVISILIIGCDIGSGLLVLTQAPTQNDTPRPLATTPPQSTQSGEPLPSDEPVLTGSTTYDVRNTLTLTNEGLGVVSKLEVTIALIRDYAPYQDVVSFQASPPETLDRIIDGHGNEYAYYEFFNIAPGDSRTIALQYRIIVNELHFDWFECQGEVPDGYLNEETYLDTNSGDIRGIVANLTDNTDDLCSNSRLFYDYVIDSLDYIAYNPDDVGASGALRDGGGDCTEFADLAITLHRAGGIPARFLEGVTYDPYYDGRITHNEAKHDWMEAYLPGIGWVPMDATWGQSSWSDRETYYAGMTDDHIVVTSGRNLDVLEGGHFYLWYFWWEGIETSVEDEETWAIARVVE
jgi:transglutaminase-like putative cysteine protease